MSVSACQARRACTAGDRAMRPLDAMRVVSDASTTQAMVAVRHLTHLGATWESSFPVTGAHPAGDTIALRTDARGTSPNGVRCDIARPPIASRGDGLLSGPDTVDPFAQAISGLMAVHGLDQRRPRRLGLDVGSHAAGVLAATGLIAAELARRRGAAMDRVETSTVRGALTFLTHHTAIATCANDARAAGAGEGSGPPFISSDGVVFELEASSRDAWLSFWGDLGVDRAAAERAWSSFVSRYDSSSCTLPPVMHTAIGTRTSAQIIEIAQNRRMTTCRQRGYDEILSACDWIRDAAPQLWPGPLALPPPWLARAHQGRRDAVARASSGERPLSGMRVVETTHGLPGPLAGQLLRMLGADVTRIEPPGGDPGRALYPQAGGVGAGFRSCNRDKTVVELDYKSGAGRAALTELAADADVFVHNWLPGRAEALGFDAVTLAARNPALVHTTISGWAGAADTDRVGIEYFVQAASGCSDGLSPHGSTPEASRLILCGVMAALLACEATVAALCDRERTRRGHALETSLFMGAMALQGEVLQDIGRGTERGRRCGRPMWTALEQPLRTADGYLAVDANDDGRRLHEVCGVDPSAHNAEAVLLDVLAGAASGSWEGTLLDAGIPCVVVREGLATMPHDPLLRPILEPAGGGCWAPASPWSFA